MERSKVKQGKEVLRETWRLVGKVEGIRKDKIRNFRIEKVRQEGSSQELVIGCCCLHFASVSNFF